MSWRIRIVHHSGYRYRSEVRASYNEARITPLPTSRQLTLESRVEATPNIRPFRYVDYWGTIVDAFDIQIPHDELTVVGTSLVETSDPEVPPPAPPGWSDLATPSLTDTWHEYLTPTGYTDPDAEIEDLAACIAGAHPPAEAAEQAMDWVRGHLTYERGATAVSTSAVDAYRAGRGVCQDFAHLGLSLLRAMGLPARYVSGYLHTDPDANLGETVTGESHAWIDLWLGQWVPYDLTNGIPVGERHVTVARGRDYGDVTPLKGIYHGGAADDLGVSVTLVRVR